MNKKMLLLALLVAAAPVLQMAGSVEAMYQDVNNIIEDKHNSKNDSDRLNNLENALFRVLDYKGRLEAKIYIMHSRVDYEKMAGLAFGALSGIFFGASVLSHYVDNLFIKEDRALFALLGVLSATRSVVGLCKKKISLYYSKKKIAELNVMITRLQAMKKELLDKIDSGCMYCSPTSDVISPMANTCTNPMYEKHECNYCHRIVQ